MTLASTFFAAIIVAEPCKRAMRGMQLNRVAEAFVFCQKIAVTERVRQPQAG